MTPRRLAGGAADTWQWDIDTARRLTLWMSREARGIGGGAPLDEDVYSTLAVVEERLDALQAQLDLVIRAAVEAPGVLDVVAAASAATLESGLLAGIATEVEGAVSAWANARELPLDQAWSRLLSVEVLVHSVSSRTGAQPPAFSLYLVSPNSPDQVSLLGLQPRASRDPSWPNSKLYGTRFGHFGAFGSTAFRDWDWMWGRLDRVVGLEAGQLIALARESGETQFEAIIDDVAGMAANNPLMAMPTSGGFLKGAKARIRARVLRFGIRRAAAWAKRLVRSQCD